MTGRAFQHVSPPVRVFCGADCLDLLGRELDRVGSRRAVIVCGASLARRSDVLDLVRSALGERCAGVFSGAREHSPIPAVEAGAAEVARWAGDGLVAVGGGSAMVTARAINILLSERADLRSLATVRGPDGSLNSPRLSAPKLPHIVLPTTPTTAAVKAGTAVHDPETGARHALFDPKTRAAAVFVHPTLLGTAPRALTAAAALDALTSAVEGLMSSTAGDPLAEAALMHAIRMIAACAARDGFHDGPEARIDLALAAILAGQGTDSTGAGLATALGHAIGHAAGVANSAAKAIVLPGVIQFNAEAARAGLGNIATALAAPASGDPAATTIAALAPVLAALDAPSRLREIGVRTDDLRAIADKAMGDWFARRNARRIGDAGEIVEILRRVA